MLVVSTAVVWDVKFWAWGYTTVDARKTYLGYVKYVKWPRGLKSGSAATRLPGLWVRIPPRTWKSVVSVVFCQVEVSASG